MNLLRLFALSALAVAVGGCGFALRGSDTLPASLQYTYIESGRDTRSLVRELERQFVAAGAQLAPSKEDASAVLRIVDNDTGQRVLSVTTTGGPEEFEVYHIVRFEVAVDGRQIFGPQELTLTRDYTFDKNDVLGKRHEYDNLSAALRKDMANLMLRRLSVSPELR